MGTGTEMQPPAGQVADAALYIGLMSGTSLDGVDGVLADFSAGCRVCASAHAPMPAPLRAEFLALNDAGGSDELARAALAANELARVYADVVARLLHAADVPAAGVQAVGAHGQTVRHRPGGADGVGYTVQLNAPALLAELSAITVVADFRSRDLAAGGQGAPLVPAFHAGVFARPGATVAVLNLGGIANLTVLAPGGGVLGFDCGPANALMDGWCERHTGAPFDADGRWAAGGRPIPGLLARLRAEPYFAEPIPKSTGRDLFSLAWLAPHLAAEAAAADPRDVQATLAELTVSTCADAVRCYAPAAAELVVCGGGACNGWLMQQLAQALAPLPVVESSARGLPPLQVEAAAFAWLARQCLRREPGNLPAVTGARGPRILGAIYPA